MGLGTSTALCVRILVIGTREAVKLLIEYGFFQFGKAKS